MCYFFAEFIYFVWKALGGLTIWAGSRVILRSMKVLLFDWLIRKKDFGVEGISANSSVN